jgi:hypothetical protein
MFENDGWDYTAKPPAEGDCRKLVTLAQDGMWWVGIRAFDHARQRWLNNSEPERAEVIAWRNLPESATSRFTHENVWKHAKPAEPASA